MSNQGQGLFSHVYLGFVCSYTSPKYQVSVYRTIGPLVCCFCVCFYFLAIYFVIFFFVVFWGAGGLGGVGKVS